MRPSELGGSGNAASAAEQYLTFMLGGEEYGIEILRVQEIKGRERMTRIPHTPAFVPGVINLRGAVVPVIDLRKRFGLDDARSVCLPVLIVVRAVNQGVERTIGLMVDAVSEVYSIDRAATRPPPELGAHADARFIKALSSIGEKMIILLDVDRLVGDSILQEWLGGTEAA